MINASSSVSFGNIVVSYFSANNLHTYDGVSSTDIIGSDVFFEIIEPEELGYTYRIRPAKDFGAPLVSSQRNILRYKNNKYFIGTVVFWDVTAHSLVDEY